MLDPVGSESCREPPQRPDMEDYLPVRDPLSPSCPTSLTVPMWTEPYFLFLSYSPDS